MAFCFYAIVALTVYVLPIPHVFVFGASIGLFIVALSVHHLSKKKLGAENRRLYFFSETCLGVVFAIVWPTLLPFGNNITLGLAGFVMVLSIISVFSTGSALNKARA